MNRMPGRVSDDKRSSAVSYNFTRVTVAVVSRVELSWWR